MKKTKLLQLLRGRYEEPHRAYHNMNHINAMLKWADDLKSSIDDMEVFEWAIWYHDAVYDPKKQDNEEKSAALAVKELRLLGLPAEKIIQVEAMVLATKTHEFENLTSDGALFVDVDMSILGVAPSIYAQYTRLVREEYEWVPWKEFNEGRQKLLEGWLDRWHIYNTEVMCDRLEVQARENIAKELALLRGEHLLEALKQG
jgi:predicted metal-dependent HD superfamily phosphohydrolase